jgi:hypothetical protein
MSILTELLITLASGLTATTYGYGEKNCSDVGTPKPCVSGAVTASGEVFKPNQIPSVAMAAPHRLKMVGRWIRIKLAGPYPCKSVRLNDKMNGRWISVRGFDLSPRAVTLLTGRPAKPTWSGVVELCSIN